MSLKFFDKLPQNFIEILNDKDDYNVVIEIENKEKLFTALSNVLEFRSSYFPVDEFELEELTNKLEILFIETKDDLQIEVKIWDYVIKWGIAQTSTLLLFLQTLKNRPRKTSLP
ncbi:hypothetical protein Glove_173g41 [Diversispora epigaea]|uniref:BACK domain-containing protein n=1 Tax=Diversispora epigaea TaxID=1348612 RepID=A0A397IP98_9GLOM|nr:hypothetical protein Glove_173g41 [Diversispora epigaea]